MENLEQTPEQIEFIDALFTIIKNENFNATYFYKFLSEKIEDPFEKFHIESGFGNKSITKEKLFEALKSYNNYVHPTNKI